ncbi:MULTISPECIES: DHA2 family efflux MFS transporter permease subunit [Phyllobacterium]|uniref:MFS transporter n=1 Tax=Phyllobacterium sophorae TaxID=1520277 RepID=A0A2P7BBQ9_9HYPH|nr:MULTISPECIES: DHA2 family efflux MFS transporter permease subunit [Phyllobacterium]PSH63904.1 MFS transporter [Phyllobacterium sophorae]UXN63270.1 DHA2 family efflux MFS transporter permease subunit [Phyllobacterium sp. A18/5-2]
MNRIVPLVLAVALFMEQMDSTVISTSLPAIAADIGTSPIALKLALTAYLVSLAVFIPVSGWMADRFGAKNVFRAAIVVFVLGSIACAVSDSLLAFVVSRFFQGVGGAMMTPVGRLVLVRSTPRSELVGAMAWLTMPALIGPLLGPPVGGFLTTYFSWHWIFLINVPIGVIGIWFATRYLPAVETLIQRPLDVTGFFLSGIAASGIVFGLSVVSLPALPSWVGLSTLAVGIVSAILYLLHARRTAEPLLALNLFNNQVFRAAIIGGSLFRIGVGAVPFLLPLMFQIGFGMTPFQSGMITFVSALGAMSMKLVTTWFYRKTGFRNSLMYGSLVAAGFIAINGFFTPETPYLLMILLLLAGGFFRSLFFTGTNALAYADIPNEQTSQATPISSVAQQISIALGVAVAGGILEVSTNIHGGPLQLSDFHIAFFIVAAVSALACLSFRGLNPDAGAEVSGHRPLIKIAAPAE